MSTGIVVIAQYSVMVFPLLICLATTFQNAQACRSFVEWKFAFRGRPQSSCPTSLGKCDWFRLADLPVCATCPDNKPREYDPDFVIRKNNSREEEDEDVLFRLFRSFLGVDGSLLAHGSQDDDIW